MSNDAKEASKSAAWRLAVLIVILIGLLFGARFLPVQQWLRSFNDWVGQTGLAGIFIFICVYAVATVLLVPGAMLTIGAGFAFGLWKGFLAVSAGATLGAALAFLVARFIARDKIEAVARRTRHFGGLTMQSANTARSLFFCFGSVP